MTHEYTMSISLNVLNHLGLNLYSNVPAVLSEAIANSYDADADTVQITLDQESATVTILDNGHGMTRSEVNDRFLNVGYSRRSDATTATSPKYKRAVMGRKGIGKLSLFSIANTIEIYTARDGEKSALSMSVPDIRALLSTDGAGLGQAYHPSPLDVSSIEFEHGTKIVLKDLKKGIANAAASLRTRLARRFSVLGDSENFHVFIGDREVTVEDLNYFHKLQYVWVFEDEPAATAVKQRCTNAELVEKSDVVRAESDGGSITISGWIGTARTVASLKDPETGDNINKVSLIVRGKVAHEDLLEEFNENGIYASYLIGEIRVDDLDSDENDDIATSSRQRIVEDDPRFRLLMTWLRGQITQIGTNWSSLRNDEGTAAALDNPLIKEWFSTLVGDTRKKATSLFGKINQLTIDDDRQRRALFAQAVLGFETLRYRDNLDALEALDPEDIPAATSLFRDVTDIQAALYHQIVQQRIEVIENFDTFLQEDALEKVLQDHLFDNLWLLDPGWERATDRSKEERIGAAFKKINENLNDDERQSRIDIRYKRTGGMNVIVELKRRSVYIADYEILAQVEKYRNAVQKHLDSIGSPEALEVVVVVGRELKNWDTSRNKTESIQALAQKNVRVVLYEKLLADARSGYREYLDAQHDLGRIQQLLLDLAEQVDPDPPLGTGAASEQAE